MLATGRLVEEPTEAGAGELDGVAAVLSQAVLPLFDSHSKFQKRRRRVRRGEEGSHGTWCEAM